MSVSPAVTTVFPGLNSLDQAALGVCATAAEAWVTRYLNRALDSGQYTETFSGYNQPILFLPNTPIVTVNSITIKGLGGANTYTLSSNYYDWTAEGSLFIQPQSFWNQMAGWRAGIGNVTVNYESKGLDQPTQDLLIGSVMNWFNDAAQRSGLVAMEVIGSYTYQMRADIKGVPHSVTALLNPYRHMLAV